MSYFKAEDFEDGQVEWIQTAAQIRPPLAPPLISYDSVDRQISYIQRLVAAEFGIALRHLLGPRRGRVVARPRQIAYWLCVKGTDATLPAIGLAFNKDHTTIHYGAQNIDALRERNQGLRLHTNELLARVDR